MYKSLRQRLGTHRHDLLVGLAIFAITLLTFLFSRIHQVGDSRYELLVSQSLLERGSFALDGYRIPGVERVGEGYMKDDRLYQLEVSGGRLYYIFPPGSSVLSLPYVALMKVMGISTVNADRSYNLENEAILQAGLAALLMAGLACIFYYTARLLLPTGWSALAALGAAWGSQVYSTASRALWSDTWGIFLLGLVVLMLLADAEGRWRLRPVLLASLLAWLYFVRPTYAIPILAITAYLMLYRRGLFIWYAVTGILWLAGFVAYSWGNFGRALPAYYSAGRLTFDNFWEALAGNLISPARGLFVYVPALLFVLYLVARYRKRLPSARLTLMALAIIVAHWVVISGFPHWYGGHSYGPRLMTGVVPWLFLLGVLGLAAMLSERGEAKAAGSAVPLGRRLQGAAGALLLLLSMVINTLGATSHATALWNMRPVDVDKEPSRVWDWRHPQFLAKWQ